MEFLKFDFPRIPYPSSKEYFQKMIKYGRKLREMHISETDLVNEEYQYAGSEYPIVEKIVYKNNIIFLNTDKDQFKDIPEDLWNMYFGGYQPLQKWLKDRKGYRLTNDERKHYLSMITTLASTKKLMEHIDDNIIL